MCEKKSKNIKFNKVISFFIVPVCDKENMFEQDAPNLMEENPH